MLHTHDYFVSSDGLQLFRQAWLPDGDPRGVVLVIHGLGEHSGRYGHVADRLAGAGYAVHALDHRGHGKSNGKRAFVKRYDELMTDLAQFRRMVEEQHPELPLVVLGHSMGGNLAVGHVLDHQDGVAGLALSGAALKAGDDLSGPQITIFKAIARVVPGFRPQALSADAISRDPAVVAAYRDDPLVFTGKISAGLGAALLESMDRFPARYGELRLPVLIMHGTEDQLTPIEGSRELERLATNAHVTSHYFEGLYHEIFNEPEQAEVLDDLVEWLDGVTG
ncbi:MAG: alpha/beta hydrolase [Ilumatobacter sp.]|uniref:alpha/beta hydrolase n=1 Tax=Ilumatobacter sp. TaxID=1967498 RepID=UPI00260ADDFB|nr:alpha/beta hydrolase [Ilumatobacter sp.]MDJ0767499.1 alpha/beta hydrolase [Ilumatobacter sp.]